MNVVMVVMERKGRKKTKRININNVAAVSRQGWVFGRWKKKKKNSYLQQWTKESEKKDSDDSNKSRKESGSSREPFSYQDKTA